MKGSTPIHWGQINIYIMEESILKREHWVEISTSEAESIRGGIGIGDIRRLLKLIGSFFNFAHEYYEDFKRGYENGWDMF